MATIPFKEMKISASDFQAASWCVSYLAVHPGGRIAVRNECGWAACGQAQNRELVYTMGTACRPLPCPLYGEPYLQ
jgi:inner membrane protein involved in colicin E2 resistance